MKEVTVEGKRVRVRTLNSEPSKTQQQFKETVDVNNIVAKYRTTGEWLHLTKKSGVYADVSNITDYQESMQKVLNANSAFAALPSHIRTRFGNDPAALLQFLHDPNNYDEGVKLGLYEKKQPVDPEVIRNESNESNTTRDPVNPIP